jgi:hypothetical protein
MVDKVVVDMRLNFEGANYGIINLKFNYGLNLITRAKNKKAASKIGPPQNVQIIG